MKTIVVGTDGSSRSMSAVTQAATLAAALGARLHVAFVARLAKDVSLSVWTPVPMPDGHDQDVMAHANAAVAEAAAAARQCGAETDAHVLDGDAARALIDLCDTLDADLLVVGNRGMTGASRLLLGSVPNRCAHQARCSVLIARTT